MPSIDSILQPVLEHPAFRSACQAAVEGRSGVIVSGLTPSAKALVTAGLAGELARPVMILVASNEVAECLTRAAATFFPWVGGDSGEVATLPAFDCSPYDGRSPHAEILERRAVTLWKLARGRIRLLFAPLAAAMGRFCEPLHYASLGLELKLGEEVPLADLVEHLSAVGYGPAEPVTGPGQFSLRGGIVDIFPPEGPWGGPFRIEFFGDQIESVREFDPTTQRSRRSVSTALILPLSEVQRTPGFFTELVRVLAARDSGSRERGGEPPWTAEYSAAFAGWEFFAPLVEQRPHTLFSLFETAAAGRSPMEGAGPTPLLVWDEPGVLRRHLEQTFNSWHQAFESVRDVSPPRPRPEDVLLTQQEFWQAVGRMTAIGLKELAVTSVPEPGAADHLSSAGRSEAPQMPPADSAASADGRAGGAQDQLVLSSQPAPKFHGDVKNWIRDLQGRREAGETIILVSPTAGKAERLREILNEYEIPLTEAAVASRSNLEPQPSRPVLITRGELDDGLAFPEVKWALLTDADVFGGFPWAAPSRHDKSIVSSFLSDLSDLKVGDYVVHVDHGVGLYQGLRQLEVEGKRRDFMLLIFQDDARLYVPLERLDLVEKYRSGSDGVKPQLDRLGGASWARTKTRVKRALRDMAEELLRLYAQRKMSGGHAYGADTPWQKEFEEAFEFEETPDQLTALADIKRDLESPEPMDRLLCGDVGYGKTELAMRAAFKVVQEGRQVAVLAPTTVLAFQHYTTFRQRMASFPVAIEMLSRFRSAAEQRRILGEVQVGRVDIVIGTHRLLSKDVQFRDLGLLIVDEEQRFGVAAKEKLKKLRANVDVLTLSATPIPRTLHMSLGGLRDLSVIETPPRGRLAIQTIVAPFSQAVIERAIMQEMERQGQVYFVHNRVESIFSIAALIQRLVPTARIGVGHGQMPEKELERVMLKFIQGQYDVLVSTAIIENGLDIPRANTIIINHADRFGLADLYQLRGRVGRSSRRAYAYLLIPAEEALTPLAQRRLAALKEFSDLGSGFRLAALDLELRGAGNVLGAEQSGHLNAIGLDLYLRMLEQTVDELKGKPARPEVRTTLNLGLEIKIPDSYIADESQRLRMYKRIAGLANPDERAELEAELVDRYGAIPAPVMTLLDYALLKSLAERLLVQSVDRKADEVWIRFHEQTPLEAARIAEFVQNHPGASLRPDGVLRIHLRGRDGEFIGQLQKCLQQLQTEE